MWRKILPIVAGLLLIGIIANPVSAALPDTLYQVEGTDIIVADSTYNGILGTPTDQITLTSLAAGSARQGDVIDFGTNRATLWEASVDFPFGTSAPASGDLVDVYLAFTPDSSGADAPGGTDGSDAAYSGTSGDSLDDSLKQLQYIGSLVATSDANAHQYRHLGYFKTPQRYANLVVDNNATQAMTSNATGAAILIQPLEIHIID